MVKKIGLFVCIVIGIAAIVFGVTRYKKWKDRNEVPYITIVGPIEMADGIGRQSAELAELFLKDFKTNIIARHYNRSDVPVAVKTMMSKKNKQQGKILIFEESLWAPGEDIARVLGTVDSKNQIRIAYSMLEYTRIPQEWVMQLNLYYDAVAVPDAFLIKVYKESGVKIPVFELPLGLDLSANLKQPIKKTRNPIMVFGNLGSTLDRKNQIGLIRAFAKALGNVEDAVLHINTRGGDLPVRKAILDEIAMQGCANIHYTEIKLRKDAYLKFFKTLDCYVSLAKGEGFSIQPREAMSLGIPVIATNNTGQETICKSQLVRSVTSALLEPAKYSGARIPSGYQFNCEVDEAALAIKDIYDNYDKYLSQGEKAREWASFYDYSNNDLKDLYRTLVNPKKIVLGDKDVLHKDYIETSSKELYEKYLRIAIFRK